MPYCRAPADILAAADRPVAGTGLDGQVCWGTGWCLAGCFLLAAAVGVCWHGWAVQARFDQGATQRRWLGASAWQMVGA